ncbi:relaxase/mobilization nuclease domain-containing protein [Litoreibacter roseus]|uniref:MobA/VirD2-like nuclease domain-containing protein n=1 Tax=Litoreibacter roseus TaxID=2601869 RepID=A0A6N6JLN1_9RHOB|nr:relaxase/mobilization nuclease domain-containing protein [Litoreibacter roseus]GFE67216.1 hypothetical protein KIN_42900 [Litoreibacter roseus]
MSEPLALYHAVTGKLWEEERIRGQKQARIAARVAGRHQWRSGQRLGRASTRNFLKSVLPESQAAVFKRIRAGGCKTRQSLGHQLAYVNDKAIYTYSTMTNPLTDGTLLTAAQRAEIVESWAGTWRGTTKLGFTSHLLLSFPTDVGVDDVREITLDWAEHFFESGAYGDHWDYVLAVHDDRAHTHAHIILNNRGRTNGTWFSCWAEGVMSPQLMREKQAEIAERYGVALEATRRLERGIFEKTPGLEEIYLAKKEARLPREIALSPQERATAKMQVAGFAKEYRDLADVLDHMDQTHLGHGMRRAAATLGTGAPFQFQTGEIDMETIRSVGEAIDYAEKTIEALWLKAEELGASDRPAFEIKAAPVIRDLSQMVPDPDLRARFGRELVEPYPPGGGNSYLRAAFMSGRDELLEVLKSDAAEVGLDAEELCARIEAGGTTNYGLAQDWVERDMAAVLARGDIDPMRANADQRAQALEAVDLIMDRLQERARELGVETELGDDLDDPRVIEDEDHGPDRPLQELANILRSGALLAEQKEAMAHVFKSVLLEDLGPERLAELRCGTYAVLANALPDTVDQITVAQGFLELTSEETGDPVYMKRASALQQEKATAIAQETAAKMERGRALEADPVLIVADDEMGL